MKIKMMTFFPRLQWFLLILLTLFSSCKEEVSEPIAVSSKGILTPLEVSYLGAKLKDDQLIDLGEFVRAGDPRVMKFRIKNNSSNIFQNIDLEFQDESVQNFKFSKGEEADAESFPGVGGNCQRTLASGQSCTIEIQFESNISGTFQQTLVFNYNNLVEYNEQRLNVKILSGDPASLIFTPDQTQYHFGNLVGTAETPLVERSTPQDYEQILTIKNAGELRARNMVSSFEQACISKATGACPAGQNQAYSMENIDCPDELLPEEECQIKVMFTPLNQGSALEEKQIQYTSVSSLNYGKTPQNEPGALKAYYTTVSANIEAAFTPSLPTFSFTDPVVVGNREVRSFRIKNDGFRPGILRSLLIYDEDDTQLLYRCIKGTDPDLLECLDAQDGNPIALSEFPFKFKDKQDCLSPSFDHLVPNDSGCLFDILFQPSIEHKSAGSVAYKVRFDYDSKWLDAETLYPADPENPLANEPVKISISGNYQAAAKIVLDKFVYDGETHQIDSEQEDLYKSDIGKVTLQNPSYEAPTSLVLTYKNTGETKAENVAFEDGSGVAIPIGQETDLGGTDEGAQSPTYFRNINIAASQCSVIQPGASCEISITFVPTGRATEQGSHESMFDQIVGIKNANNYKAFLSSYHDGSNFTDSNFTSSKDTLDKELEFRINALLLSKGLLGDFQEVKGFNPEDTASEKRSYILRIRNTGTGVIPYIYNNGTRCKGLGVPGCPDDPTDSLQVIRASEDASYDPSSYGADYDCAELIDWDASYAIGDSVNFGMGESCTLKFETSPRNEQRIDELLLSPAQALTPELYEIQRFFSLNPNPDELWEYENFNNIELENLRLSYYDFDVEASIGCVDGNGDPVSPCDPALSVNDPSYTQGLGDDFNFEEDLPESRYDQAVKIIPISASPRMGAMIYRPEFTKSALLDEEGGVIFPAQTIEERWFYGATNFPRLTGETSAHPEDEGDLMRAFHSQAAYSPGCPDCEYTVYFGSFPANKEATLSFDLKNYTQMGDITDIQATLPPEITWEEGMITEPKTLTSSNESSHPMVFKLDAATAGTYLGYIEYTYDTGVVQSIPEVPLSRTIRIQVAANVIEAPPELEFSYQNYELTLYDNQAPDENLITDCQGVGDGGNHPCPLVDSHLNNPIPNPESNRLLLQMVKQSSIEQHSGYVKKRLIVKNSSNDESMTDFELLTRESTATGQSSTLNIRGLQIDENTCDSTSTLLPQQTCYIDYRYQPDHYSTSGNFSVFGRYLISANQYYNQNVHIEHNALTPGEMIACLGDLSCQPASEMKRSTIQVASDGSTMSAYEIDFGQYTQTGPLLELSETITLNHDSQILTASFLKSWHEYLVQHDNTATEAIIGEEYNSLNLPELSLHPKSATYDTFDGDGLTPIFVRNYPDGSPRVEVLASSSCFYGGNAHDDFDHFQRGFLGGPAASNQCLLKINLNIDINYVGKEITNTSPYEQAMELSYFKLPYYSFERANDGLIHFYTRIKVIPDSSYALTTPQMSNVEAYNDPSVEFSFPELEATSAAVGGISGYRIYYANAKNSLQNDNFYKKDSNVNYVSPDFNFIADQTNVILDTSDIPSMAQNTAYYFRVMTIRENPNYTAEHFHDLPDGYYFSPNDLPILRVVIPPNNHSYDHSQVAIVKDDIELDGFGSVEPMNFQTAKSTCSNGLMNYNFFDSGTSFSRTYKLINEAIWEFIRQNPYASNYSVNSPMTIPHWLDAGAYDIHSTFSGYSGYNELEETQEWPDLGTMYFRCSDGCSADRKMAGGYYFTEAYDYMSYSGESLEHGQARCYVDVSR